MAVVQHPVIRSQNQHRVTASLTGRGQPITEVQAPGLLQEVTAHHPLLQVREITEAANLQAAVEAIKAVGAAVVVHIPGVVPAEVLHLQKVAAVHVLLEVVHHRRVGDNFIKYI